MIPVKGGEDSFDGLMMIGEVMLAVGEGDSSMDSAMVPVVIGDSTFRVLDDGTIGRERRYLNS
jgi:hypothetical protein